VWPKFRDLVKEKKGEKTVNGMGRKRNEFVILLRVRANYGNAIYIKEFTGDLNDCELQHLYNYLLTLKTVANVRTIEKRGWRK